MTVGNPRRLVASLGAGVVMAGALGLAAGPAHAQAAAHAPSATVAARPAAPQVQQPVAAAKERSWQKWSPWRKVTRTNWCRTYVDATTKGSRILVTGAVFCKRAPAHMAIYLSGTGGSKSRNCSRQVFQTEGFCYIGKWVNNKRGTQKFTFATTANYLGIRLPYANVRFKA